MNADQKYYDLRGYCKDGLVYSVKEILSEHDDIDLTIDEGIFFYFAMDLRDEGESIEILNLLLSYAEDHKINKRVVAKAIEDAKERIRGTIPESVLELLKPHLEILQGSDPGDYGAAVVRPKLTIDDFVEAARDGDTTLIRDEFDIKNRPFKMLLIATAVQHGQFEVIKTLSELAPNPHQKATILRSAGDMCVKAHKFTEAESCYKQSLELHPRYHVTHSKLGVLYHRWSCEDVSKLPEASMHYKAALDLKPMGIKYEEVRHAFEMVTQELRHLESALAEDSETISAHTDELLSYYSDSEDDPTVDLVGLAGDAAAIHSDV